jgi:hypothetical protein
VEPDQVVITALTLRLQACKIRPKNRQGKSTYSKIDSPLIRAACKKRLLIKRNFPNRYFTIKCKIPNASFRTIKPASPRTRMAEHCINNMCQWDTKQQFIRADACGTTVFSGFLFVAASP